MRAAMAFAIEIVSIILLVSLASNAYLYYSVNNGLQKQATDLHSQVTILERQVADLQSQINSLRNNNTIENKTIDGLNGQILDLQKENDNLQKENDNLTSQISYLQNQSPSEIRTANLVTRLGVKYIEIQTSINSGLQKSLYINGEVWNTGNGTAYNCDLKVVTYVANDSFTDYIKLGAGTLPAGSYVDVDTHIYHSDIQKWEIFPEWTNSPY